MGIKAKKTIQISSPEIGYEQYLHNMAVTEMVRDGQVYKAINLRLVPYRVVAGVMETREDLAETVTWSSALGKQDAKITKALAAIERAIQSLVDEA